MIWVALCYNNSSYLSHLNGVAYMLEKSALVQGSPPWVTINVNAHAPNTEHLGLRAAMCASAPISSPFLTWFT